MGQVLNLSRVVAAEGTVLLKNENNLLPLGFKTKLAVFGRCQDTYYRCGTGSGGGVYVKDIPRILDSLKSNDDLVLDQTLIDIYLEWIKENPFDDGGGVWAGEPWFQKEMPLSDDVVKSASVRNDVALVIIGRTAGEDHDNADTVGSYKLTETEEDMLQKVCKYFSKVVVALNTGNLIDLSFVDKYAVDSLLYIWQGGVEGANAFSDILSGKRYPSGRLADTQVYDLTKYPATKTFGETSKIKYVEDIYVGYRFFETFQKENVRFPFGFGLSYTDFENIYQADIEENYILVSVRVKNVGQRAGKQVVQIYFEAPCGELGNPSRQLAQFVKTKELLPNEEQNIFVKFPICQMASFDDLGYSGNKACYVLLKGEYKIYAGDDVRSAEQILVYNQKENKVTERLSNALSPSDTFEVLKACDECGTRKLSSGIIQGVESDISKLRSKYAAKDIEFTGQRNIKLVDVYNSKNTLDEFLAQFSDLELATLVCGEGMSSPKATPGTAGALGGQTGALSKYGIPVCAVADGPSGIKVSKDAQTTLLPNGTMIACTFNTDLVRELYEVVSFELDKYEIDSLLGPGLNIHRSVLCGRNFEYFSEDPYLSGRMGVAITKGISKYGAFSTIKHFCCNNQEKARSDYDVVVSERALREIYLKPFEMTVKEGENVLIMTSYNSINGFWAASNYDLTTTILRQEWGFENFVMTDWWAKCNRTQNSYGNKDSLDAMVWSQNDLYMVCEDALVKSDSILKALNNGTLTRAELLRCCENILKWILKTNTFKKYVERGCVPKYPVVISTDDLAVVDQIKDVTSETEYIINAKSGRNTAFVFELSSNHDSLAQIPIIVKVDNSEFSFTVSASEKQVVRFMKTDWSNPHKIKLIYSNAVDIDCIYIKQKQ